MREGCLPGGMRTGAWPDIRHVDKGAGALDEGRVVQGDTGTEALRVDSLAELSVRHRDGGLVVSWGRKTISRTSSLWASSLSLKFLFVFIQ